MPLTGQSGLYFPYGGHVVSSRLLFRFPAKSPFIALFPRHECDSKSSILFHSVYEVCINADR